jgi:hypothetical protein
MAINNENHTKLTNRSNNTEDLKKTEKKEIAVFDELCVRGPNLRMAYDHTSILKLYHLQA